jgi:hypothetical protein
MKELEMHNQQLTEAATKYALRAQDLEQEVESLRSKPARKTQEWEAQEPLAAPTNQPRRSVLIAGL